MSHPGPTHFTQRYRVLGTLGEGAMGTVYRVLDQFEGDRECALKVVKALPGDTAELRLRFKAEYHALARLRHPNTVAVLDFGQLEDGDRFIVMELVPGQELAELLTQGPLPLPTVYHLLSQLLQALDYIHARQYVHRDIKAANIRVTPEGVLKLMDFGLMRQAHEEGPRQITGTPGYMAPEVARGAPISAAADLYSVGCLAYELVTGGLPFTGSVGEVVRAHLFNAPRAPREARAELPPAFERLIMRLLDKEPGRRPRTAGMALAELSALSGTAVARESRDQQLSFLVSGELVGREVELARIEACLETVSGGQGQALLIGAPAGTGKSRLVQEIKLKASLAGFVVMHGACHDEGMGPYDALRDALRPALAYALPEERRLFEGPLRLLFPEFASAEAPPEGVNVVDMVIEWLTALSQRHPLLFLLDDLHWADPQTIDILNQGIRRTTGSRVFCVGTFRDDETPAGNPLWQTIEEGTSHWMRPAPLEQAQQAALLASFFPGSEIPSDFSRALYSATGGNPFFTREVLQLLIEEGHLARKQGLWQFPADPAVLQQLRSIETAVQRRLAHLPEGARHLLGAAAVLGHAWELRVLQAVSDSAEDDLFTWLEELLARQLLTRTGPGQYEFPHDRVREVAYAGLEPESRNQLHQRAGAALLAEHPEDQTAIAHELGRHFLQAGDDAQAYPHLLVAAQQALARGVIYTALETWRDAEGALSRLPQEHMPERLAIWMQIGHHGFHMATALAGEMLSKAYAAYQADPVQVARLLAAGQQDVATLLTLYAVTHAIIGKPADAFAASEQLVQLVPDQAKSAAAAVVQVARVPALLVSGRIDELLVEARQAARLLEAPLPALASTLMRSARVGVWAAQNAIAFQGQRPSPEPRDRALAYAREMGDEDPYLAWFYFGVWPAWTGHVEEAERYLELTLRKTRRVGGPPFAWVLYLRPYLLWQQGEYALALEQIEKNLLVYPHLRQQALAFNKSLALRGHLLADLGRPAEALAVFDDLIDRGQADGLGFALMLGMYGRAATLATEGELAAAEPIFQQLATIAGSGPLRNPLSEAYAWLGLGRCAAPRSHSEALSRFDAVLARVRSPEMDNLFLQAHTHLARSSVLRAAGRPTQARQALTEAGRLFHRMRNPHWLHLVNEELARTTGITEPLGPQNVSLEARWARFKGL